MKDLMIGAIANYSPNMIQAYVHSIEKCEFDGDKVMLVYDVPDQTINFLKQHGWSVFTSKLTGHPHMHRLIDIYFYLRQSEEYRYVITTDVRDVVFQTNPVKYLEENLNKKIIASSENVLYKDEPWGTKNILEGYGPAFFEIYKDTKICNVGVLAGEYKELMNMLLLNYMVSQAGDVRHFTDQSSFNFIINNELIIDKIQIEGIETNWALQMGTLTNNKHIGEYELKHDNGLIMHDKKPFVIVHQYDRDETTNKIILGNYNVS